MPSLIGWRSSTNLISVIRRISASFTERKSLGARIIKFRKANMEHKQETGRTAVVYSSSWRAFYLYYLAMAICWFGPWLNPQFSAQIGLSPRIGFWLGLILLACVFYLKHAIVYEVGPLGVKKIWLWPARQELIRWEDLEQVRVLAGLTQTLLGIGNVVVQGRAGQGRQLNFYGLARPKEVMAAIQRSKSEFTTSELA